MLLQVEIASEVVKNSFNTNPDTVFGVLVSVLIAGIVVLVYGMFKKDKNHTEAIERMQATCKSEMIEQHKEHKQEMKEIFESHAKSNTAKYEDMKVISEKMIEASTSMLSKLDELIRTTRL